MRFVIFKSEKNGQWYWRLVAANHQIVAVGGEGYVSKQGAINGIAVVQSTTSTTPILEE